jgi:hypothetical protein
MRLWLRHRLLVLMLLANLAWRWVVEVFGSAWNQDRE